ncbi:MAG: helix-hairpin-helix domain-containing protein [Candidatus Poribacteria bacterium]
MAALTDIKGVGPSRAERLSGAGYGTPEDLAEASVDEVRAIMGVGTPAAEAILLAARDLAPDGTSVTPEATPEAVEHVNGSGDIIDDIAARIVGSSKERKRAIRAVSAQIASRLAKPVGKQLGKNAPKTKHLRKALAHAMAKELRNA